MEIPDEVFDNITLDKLKVTRKNTTSTYKTYFFGGDGSKKEYNYQPWVVSADKYNLCYIISVIKVSLLYMRYVDT